MDDVTPRDVDRGWAWVVFVVSVVNIMMLEFFVVSVGIFQVEFLENFSGSKGFISLIGALALGCITAIGPVAGIVSNMLTPRVAIMTGAALMAMGMVAASFATDLTTLLVLYGLVVGLGCGMCYTPCITVPSLYFQRYRVRVTGMTLASTGLGMIFSPLFLRWLIENYGWRYALAVYGCLMAQMCVLAALIFPHDPSQNQACCCGSQRPRADSLTEREVESSLRVAENKSLSRLRQESLLHLHSCGHIDTNLPDGQVKGYIQESEQVKVDSGENMWPEKGELPVLFRSMDTVKGSRSTLNTRRFSEMGSVFLGASLIWSVSTTHPTQPYTLRQQLSRLAANRFLWVMCLNQLFLMAGVAIHAVLFPSYAISVGVPFSDLPYIFFVYGASTIVIRAASGFVFSLIPGHLLKAYFIMQVALGLVLGLVPLYGLNLNWLYVFNFLYSLTYSTTFTLVTPILVLYTGTDLLPVTFGIIMLCCGLAYIVAPPIGGVMYDIFLSYKVAYYIAGATVGLGALSLSLLLLIKDLKPMDDMDSTAEMLVMSHNTPSDKDDDANIDISDVIVVPKNVHNIEITEVTDDMARPQLYHRKSSMDT